MKILVTGGCGFLGSHLVDRLLEEGHHVTVVDNYYTGNLKNISHHTYNERFQFVLRDVCEPLDFDVDRIYHLACPASPIQYKRDPIYTAKTCFMGTLNVMELAKMKKARVLIASTSEIYGEPTEHPQHEDYYGNVNTLGERSCYDEGKRIGETLAMDFHRTHGVNVRIARIFNTYGPRMSKHDGRVVSTFLAQAHNDEPLTVMGDGSQTRSFQYVTDCVEGLVRVMESEHTCPFNIGNPEEITIKELVEVMERVLGKKLEVRHIDMTENDPTRRKPDITRAKEKLNWEPKVSLEKGIFKMVSI